LISLVWLMGSALAADHIDAPTATADPAADISDFYTWHDDTYVYVALNFAGLSAAGDPAMYDSGVLYGVHIDTDQDNVADTQIWVRFGQDALGAWGVQVTNLPGTGAPVVGPVEAILEAPGGKVFAGLREDPFRFDFTGFNTTLASGTLSFDATHDDFAGTNITSIVLAMDKGAVGAGSDQINLWATTARVSE